jgi:hypothetical protein
MKLNAFSLVACLLCLPLCLPTVALAASQASIPDLSHAFPNVQLTPELPESYDKVTNALTVATQISNKTDYTIGEYFLVANLTGQVNGGDSNVTYTLNGQPVTENVPIFTQSTLLYQPQGVGFSLLPNQTLTRQVHISLPTGLAATGGYGVTLELTDLNGDIVTSHAFSVTKAISGNGKFNNIGIISTSLVDASSGQSLDALNPIVAASALPKLSAQLSNSGATVALTPRIEYYTGTSPHGSTPLAAWSGQSFMLAAQAQSTVSYPVTTITKPGNYTAVLSFLDANGSILAPQTSYKLTVSGTGVSFVTQSVTTKTMLLRSVSVTTEIAILGSADGQTAFKGNLKSWATFSNSNKVLASQTQSINVPAAADLQLITTNINYPDHGLRVAAVVLHEELLSLNGNVVSTATVNLVPTNANLLPLLWLVLLIALVFVLLIALRKRLLAIHLPRRTGAQTMFPVLVIMCLALIVPHTAQADGALDYAKANTGITYGRQEIEPPIQCTSVLTQAGACDSGTPNGALAIASGDAAPGWSGTFLIDFYSQYCSNSGPNACSVVYCVPNKYPGTNFSYSPCDNSPDPNYIICPDNTKHNPDDPSCITIINKRNVSAQSNYLIFYSPINSAQEQVLPTNYGQAPSCSGFTLTTPIYAPNSAYTCAVNYWSTQGSFYRPNPNQEYEIYPPNVFGGANTSDPIGNSNASSDLKFKTDTGGMLVYNQSTGNQTFDYNYSGTAGNTTSIPLYKTYIIGLGAVPSKPPFETYKDFSSAAALYGLPGDGMENSFWRSFVFPSFGATLPEAASDYIPCSQDAAFVSDGGTNYLESQAEQEVQANNDDSSSVVLIPINDPVSFKTTAYQVTYGDHQGELKTWLAACVNRQNGQVQSTQAQVGLDLYFKQYTYNGSTGYANTEFDATSYARALGNAFSLGRSNLPTFPRDTGYDTYAYSHTDFRSYFLDQNNNGSLSPNSLANYQKPFTTNVTGDWSETPDPGLLVSSVCQQFNFGPNSNVNQNDINTTVAPIEDPTQSVSSIPGGLACITTPPTVTLTPDQSSFTLTSTGGNYVPQYPTLTVASTNSPTSITLFASYRNGSEVQLPIALPTGDTSFPNTSFSQLTSSIPNLTTQLEQLVGGSGQLAIYAVATNSFGSSQSNTVNIAYTASNTTPTPNLSYTFGAPNSLSSSGGPFTITATRNQGSDKATSIILQSSLGTCQVVSVDSQGNGTLACTALANTTPTNDVYNLSGTVSEPGASQNWSNNLTQPPETAGPSGGPTIPAAAATEGRFCSGD